MTEATPLIRAVLNNDIENVRKCLTGGESPNQTWGSFPVVTHAANHASLTIFKLLIEFGATIPDDLLSNIVSWELYDWQICSDEEEANFIKILEVIKLTKAWSTINQRQELAERLDGNLEKVAAILLGNTKAEQNAAHQALSRPDVKIQHDFKH